MISFERIDNPNVILDEMICVGETNVFQTLPWLNLVAQMHNVEPVIISIKSNEIVKGFFYGFIVNKFGLKILGSPFRGWATYFMGFNMIPDVSRVEILHQFPAFVFDQLHCNYFEVIDPHLTHDEILGLPYKVDHLPWFALDLTPSEEILFKNMKDSGRRGIRKAIKSGVTVEEASDIEFADEYYAQYIGILEKRSLKPTYSLEFVKGLIHNIFPTNSLLMLRARNSGGICIATGLFLYLNEIAVFWGGASLQQYQNLRPNDLLMWHAIKTLKKQGASVLHLGGEAEQFKLKFGSRDAQIFRLKMSKNIILGSSLHFVSSIQIPRYKNWFLRKL